MILSLAILVAPFGAARADDAPPIQPPKGESKSDDGDPKKVDPETVLLDMFKKESDTTNSLGMVLVWVKAGYRVAKYEVMQSQYEQLTGANPSRFSGPSHPVESVTWIEATQFCKQLTEKEQKAGKLPKAYSYSLPTEKQWEYFVDNAKLEDAITSYLGDRRKTEDVGGLGPNDFGLYDVRGNVWEWCTDTVARGSSWMSYEDYIWVPFRFIGESERRYDDIGFRIILQGDPNSGK